MHQIQKHQCFLCNEHPLLWSRAGVDGCFFLQCMTCPLTCIFVVTSRDVTPKGRSARECHPTLAAGLMTGFSEWLKWDDDIITYTLPHILCTSRTLCQGNVPKLSSLPTLTWGDVHSFCREGVTDVGVLSWIHSIFSYFNLEIISLLGIVYLHIHLDACR